MRNFKIYKLKWIFLSLIFWSIVFLKIPSEFLDFGGDSAQYIILAESLAKGLGYRAINYPNSPFFYHYPPGFPLILSFVVKFFGRNFYLMHILIAFLGYLSIIFSYHLFKKYTDQNLAFIIVLLMSCNWVFLHYSSQRILSDVPYLLFSILFLFFISGYIDKREAVNREGVLAVLILIVCYFIRYVGLVLFVAAIISLLFYNLSLRVKFKKIIFISLVFLFPFFVWQITLRKLNPLSVLNYSKQFFLIDPYRPYLGTLFENPRFIFFRIIEGINYYYQMIAKSLFLYFIKKTNFLREILPLISLILIFIGVYKHTSAKKNYLFFFYFFIYFLLIAFWPYREGVRFLIPILPFLYFYLVIGINKVFKKFPPQIFYFVIVFLFIFNLHSSFSLKKISHKNLPSSLKHFFSLHSWINKNLPKKGIVISRKPTVTYFFTQHKSIIYPFSSPEKIWEKIKKEKVKYIIIDEFSRETYYYLLPFIYKYRKNLKLLYRIGNTGIFKVLLD